MKTKLGILAFFLLLTADHAVSQSLNNYYLPQVANGAYADGSFRTSFVFFNNTGSTANVIMNLTDDAGNPFEVTIPGLGSDSNFLVMLPPGASRIFQTDGTGPLSAGAAEILSTVPIGVSGIFTIYDTNGNFVTESGVGSSTPLTDFVIPVESGGNYSTGLALFNPGADASYTARLLDANGNQVDTTTKEMASGTHAAFFLTGSGQLFPNQTDIQGTLVVHSDVALSAVVLRQSSSPFGFTSLPVVSKSSTQTNLSLAQVANGSYGAGSFRTSFLLFSIASSTANVTLTLTKDDGTPMPVTISGLGTNSTFTFPIQAGKALFLKTDGSGSLAAGSARITSDVPIGATGIFSVYDSQGNFQTEAGVGDSPIMTQFTLPVDLTGNFDTGVAFFNPGTSPATITLRFMNASGENNSQNPQITLPPNGHNAGFVSQFFPGIGNIQGTLAVSSTAGVAAITLRQNSSPFGFTTLPVVSGIAPGTAGVKALLSQSQSGVNASTNVVINQTLPSGSILSGTISGGYGVMVTAQSVNDVFYGSVNFSGRYLVVLPNGTFTVKVMFAPLNQDTTSILVYSYPSQVQVSGNTTLDMVLPAPTLFQVSGAVSGLTSVPQPANPELVFTANDNSIQSYVSITNGTYSGLVPAGSYSVSLSATNLPVGIAQAEDLNVFNIGALTVSSNTTADYTVPNLVSLNGTVNTITPWASLGGDVMATDTSGPSVDPFAFLAPPKTSSVAVSSSALSYQLLLAQNRTYSMNITHSITGNVPSTPLGEIFFPVTISTVNMNGNNNYNFTVPNLPGQVAISGRVIDGSGAGVADVAVSAYSESLTGASNVGFAAGGTTDSNGNYGFSMLSGTNYQVTFTPQNPTP